MKSLKIWGSLITLFKNEKCKVDYLYIRKNSACSIHNHSYKINRFFLIKGDVRIITDFGEQKLREGETFDVAPNLTHQFKALKNSFMLEIAFVEEGTLEEKDISRKVQGGEFIDGKFFTLDQLKQRNWKDYEDYE